MQLLKGSDNEESHSHEHSHEHSHDDHSSCGHDHDHDDHSSCGHDHHDHHHHHHHDHHHDDKVKSVSLVVDGEMDLEKVNFWLGALVEMRSEDLYRMKGVLAIKDFDRRFVCQVSLAVVAEVESAGVPLLRLPVR